MLNRALQDKAPRCEKGSRRQNNMYVTVPNICFPSRRNRRKHTSSFMSLAFLHRFSTRMQNLSACSRCTKLGVWGMQHFLSKPKQGPTQSKDPGPWLHLVVLEAKAQVRTKGFAGLPLAMASGRRAPRWRVASLAVQRGISREKKRLDAQDWMSCQHPATTHGTSHGVDPEAARWMSAWADVAP